MKRGNVMNRKNIFIVLSLAVVAFGIAVTLYNGSIGADSLTSQVTNTAEVTYRDSVSAKKATSNNVAVTVEAPVASPTPASEYVFSDMTGKRLTTQRMQFSVIYKKGSEINTRAKVYFVYDYFLPTNPLPTADSVPILKRSVEFRRNSTPVGYYTADMSGNANQHVIGYFEARDGTKVLGRTPSYFLDAKAGSDMVLLP